MPLIHGHTQLLAQRMVRSINRQIDKRVAAAGQYRLGTVTSTSPFQVKVGANASPSTAFALDSYQAKPPAVNDVVVCVLFGRQVLALGTWS